MSTKRNIAILGGAGFLGERISLELSNRGHSVHIIDLKASGALESANITQHLWDGNSVEDAVSIVDEIWSSSPIDVFLGLAAANPRVETGNGFLDIDEISREELSSSFDSDVISNYLVARSVIRLARSENRPLNLLFFGSDYSHLGPDQRIYDSGVKPITYSVTKSAILGLSRYFATRWPGENIRSNVFSPGGVLNGQNSAFIENLSHLIPLGRMATAEEVANAVAFFCGDQATYFNGQNIIMDGGRSAW